MNLLRILSNSPISALVPETRILELYPPFLIMGVKVAYVSPDYSKLHVALPLRWYARNHNNTMFGGFMASLADPLAAILCGRIFPDCETWTKKMSIQFLRPGRTDLILRLEIGPEQIQQIRDELSTLGNSRPKFTYYYFDKKDRKIAKIENTVSIKTRGAKRQENDREN